MPPVEETADICEDHANGVTTSPAVWLAAFRTEHPDVSVHSTSRGVWFADGPTWRVYGRTLAEFLDKLKSRFPGSTSGPDR
jgi:hypothetical protein